MGSAAEAKQAQLAELRRRMAAIPARGAESAAHPPMAGPRAMVEGPRPANKGMRPLSAESRSAAGDSAESRAVTGELRSLAEPRPVAGESQSVGEMRRPAAESRAVAGVARREALAVPAALEKLLPEGGLVKGSVVRYSGGNSLLSGLLAAVTGAGGHAAVVGMPRFGLLAAAEMGARLDRLAIVTNPGPDPLEVASVLLDGLDLVILGLNGVSVPMSRTRVLTARARSKGSTLVVTGGSWAGPVLRIDTQVAGYSGLGRGCGRLRTVRLEVSVHGRSAQPREGHLALCPSNGRVEWVDTHGVVESSSAAVPLDAVRHAVS